MRLALVVRRLSLLGGTERFVEGLARHARDAGHEVVVWCFGADVDVPGVEVRWLSPEGRGRMGRLWSAQRAVRRIHREEFDHVLGFMRCSDFDLYRAGGGCHASWLESSRLSFADRYERLRDREAVNTAGLVVVNSEMAGADLRHHYGVAASKLRLVRNGVDLERFVPRSQSGAHRTRKRVGFLGSGFRRKGLDTCLRALTQVPDVELQVAGTDRNTARFARLSSRLGLEDRVHFLGAVSEPENWLPTLNLMVLPTRYDPCANSCLEAMACGVPVVSTQRNGASELFPESWMAIEDPQDDVALASSMERALQTKGLGARCRDAVEPWPAGRASLELMQLL